MVRTFKKGEETFLAAVIPVGSDDEAKNKYAPMQSQCLSMRPRRCYSLHSAQTTKVLSWDAILFPQPLSH